ncbi:MAG: hypothetical protein ACOCU8_01055 [Patescibacteria group bacterium]
MADSLNNGKESKGCRSCFLVLKIVLLISVFFAIGIIVYAVIFGVKDIRQKFFTNQVIVYDCGSDEELLLEKINQSKIVLLTSSGLETVLIKSAEDDFYRDDDIIIKVQADMIRFSQDQGKDFIDCFQKRTFN